MAPLSVTILYNKVNSPGEDVAVWERILKKLPLNLLKPRLADIREPLIHTDIQIHIEIPVFAAIPWAHTNLLLVNPDQWSDAYDAYVHAFDLILFRDPISAQHIRDELEIKGIAANHLHAIPWCGTPITTRVTDPKPEFVCFVDGSTNQMEYLTKLLPHWTSSDPVLTVYTTQQDCAKELRAASACSTVICQDVDRDTRHRIMTNYRGHLVVSAGEGFGYRACEAEAVGAFALMNELPVWKSMYTDAGWLTNVYSPSEKMRSTRASPTATVRAELDQAFVAFRAWTSAAMESRKARAASRFQDVCAALTTFLPALQETIQVRRPSKGVFHCPPLLQIDDCPPITVITPTYNRKKLFEIAFHNLLATDYPRNKIEWIVIEDNEKTPHMVGEKIMAFQVQLPELRIKYMPIEGRMTIGEKRNCAIREASNEIILFMDDDDHYPSTSFRRRVAWLTKGVKRGTIEQRIACCTTLALYDLQKGTSAVNVPPFDIAFAQRISEATLTFRKSAWEERPFPSVSIAEGEGWIQGRENEVIEMPPQQIIVAFTHGGNQSSRRVPPSDQPPSCFWGFPKEYLIFIHGLAGVEIEESKKR